MQIGSCVLDGAAFVQRLRLSLQSSSAAEKGKPSTTWKELLLLKARRFQPVTEKIQSEFR